MVKKTTRRRKTKISQQDIGSMWEIREPKPKLASALGRKQRQRRVFIRESNLCKGVLLSMDL
jgi:hypothetical protein